MPHIHEAYDYVVTVFIVYEDRVLLVNHPRYDKWIPPGGHVELDEDPEEALYREIREETGLQVEILAGRPEYEDNTVKPLLTPAYIDVHEANPPHKHIGFVYFAKASTDNFSLSSEHTSLRWFMEADLHNPEYNLSPSVIFYAKEAMSRARA